MSFLNLGRRGPRPGKAILAASMIAGSLCLLILALSSTGHPQTNPQTEQATSGMGVATGGAHPAVKDSLSRPITAGGFVDDATVVFSDITKQAGLDKFLHRSGTPEKKTILDTIGSGVALLDYDNDGWLDIYLLNGSTEAR